MSKERPILMSAPMVRAILAGTKTQTRRIVNLNVAGRVVRGGRQWAIDDPALICASPYGSRGDDLWVRETWQYASQRACSCPQPSEPSPCDDWTEGVGCKSNRDAVIYAADDAKAPRWRPSIFMPRWASRITLRITTVRVERLQDISEADAKAEGVDRIISKVPTYRNAYRYLWEDINGAASWGLNPWVWVLLFERTERTEVAA